MKNEFCDNCKANTAESAAVGGGLGDYCGSGRHKNERLYLDFSLGFRTVTLLPFGVFSDV